MKTVGDIQVLARYEARQRDLDLTTAVNLALLNTTYRRLCYLLPWPELTREDATLTTVAGQAAYNWPSVRFYDVTLVEVQDPERGNAYMPVPATTTEAAYRARLNRPADFPELYKRYDVAGQSTLGLAPAPSFSGAVIRISGLIEPTELTASGSATIFDTALADDALGLLLAAVINDYKNDPQRAQRLVARAAETLSLAAGREITPAEIKDRFLQGGAAQGGGGAE